MPESRECSTKDLNMPPRTRWVTARRIGVTLVLKLQMKAQPMHLLEYVVISRMNCDWFAASLANFSVGVHEQFWLHLTPRLTYRRRRGRWSAEMIHGFTRRAERKARAAVRCRRIVSPCFVSRHNKGEKTCRPVSSVTDLVVGATQCDALGRKH